MVADSQLSAAFAAAHLPESFASSVLYVVFEAQPELDSVMEVAKNRIAVLLVA